MGRQIAMVVSDFNDDITGKMEAVAHATAKQLGADVVKTIHVPGAFDIPIVAARLVERDDVEAVACLGAVVKGDTSHDELVCRECARALTDLSLQTGKPVTLGVIGPGVTHPQAVARAQEYAKRAVEAAVKLCDALEQAESE